MAATARSLSPARLFARRAALVVAGSALLAISAQIAVPAWPVPVTLQTLAIPVIVALLGRNLGALAVLAYLGEATLGLPVLQGFAGGLVHFVGPTGGYLVGFPVAAWLVGLLYERGFGEGYARRFVAVLLGTAVVFVTGPAWLAFVLHLDLAKAVELGVVPFLIGDVAKCLVAAGLRPRRVG
ncbi:MAG: biotin transporter BioY [Candidatus Eremiobacteraeota bacterium]|nr:biotin transporter BioY [Candidatus Eremiobacteraeota bacterium]